MAAALDPEPARDRDLRADRERDRRDGIAGQADQMSERGEDRIPVRIEGEIGSPRPCRSIRNPSGIRRAVATEAAAAGRGRGNRSRGRGSRWSAGTVADQRENPGGFGCGRRLVAIVSASRRRRAGGRPPSAGTVSTAAETGYGALRILEAVPGDGADRDLGVAERAPRRRASGAPPPPRRRPAPRRLPPCRRAPGRPPRSPRRSPCR